MTYPTEKTAIPSAEELSLKLGEESLEKILDQRQNAKDVIDKLKSVVEECDSKIGVILDINARRSLTWRGQYVVSRREPSKPRRTIDPVKLMELGVPASTIEKASKVGNPGKAGIVIRKFEEKDSGGEIDGDF